MLKMTGGALDSLTAGRGGQGKLPFQTNRKFTGLEGRLSTARSTGCFSKGLGFDSQHLHGSSQLSVTTVLETPMPSLVSVGTRSTHICTVKDI